MTAPLPDSRSLVRGVLATWPAAKVSRAGAWTIRQGLGGGSRVSSATQDWPTTEADLAEAETAMRDLGQVPQFMVRDGEGPLDTRLAAHGYAIKDPTNLWAIDTASLAGDGLLRMGSVYAMWPPLAMIGEIWTAGDIGAARQAIMARAPAPKAGILARSGDALGGAGFVACHEGTAYVHAIHVMEDQRRQGVARLILKKAAIWAREQGAETLALAVTKGNTAANPLYAALGMSLRGQYHYRIASDEEAPQ